jgi:para-nitrobenzyl esterase
MELSKRSSNIFRGIVCLLFLFSVETAFSLGVVSFVTKNGPVRGVLTNDIYVYKGIPYAKAPIGDLRFAPPQDVESWTDRLECTKYGPVYPQQPNLPIVLENTEQTEDSLTLNIWTPCRPSTTDKLPVYVYIHGGGYGAGTGNENTFDGTSFAKNGVVTVTFNYRLSTLGFFASEETYKQYGTTGNWGLLDQIKLLEWVRDNIEEFGGDPDQVTIGGESAGSWSVSALILSPLAKGLFRNAIMESGTILGIQTLTSSRADLQKSIEVSQTLAGIFGASDTAEGLNQLRQVDAGVLNYLSPFSMNQALAMQAFYMAPVYDGTVLPKDPIAALKEGNFNKVNLLIGFNRDEGTLFIPDATDANTYKSIAARMIGKNWTAFVDRFPVDANNSAAKRAQQLLAYAWFSAGTKVFLDTISPQMPVFMYNFNFAVPDLPLGAHHVAELKYAFNTLATAGAAGAEHEKLAGEMHTRWINFIKNGDPNVGMTPPTATQWPQYDTAKTEVIFFDSEITTGSLPNKENLDFAARLLYGQY